ncbi:type II secretion system protein GspC [Endozoicomonas sp. OPT23]|uniref:type II secretion system protein GspC n=1 Tax=Endozoicomonas sp. OPT23 TaxID=2072845 RepID=UPI0018919903|nr:type II secretion system protein GspC [Endozoicomonas sp. OPT23]
MALEATLAGLALVFIAKTVLALQNHSQLEAIASPALQTRTTFNSAVTAKNHSYEHLPKLELFGSFKPKPASAIAITELPRTTVTATLTGIVSHPDNSQSLAIIKTGGNQQILKSGDSITNTQATIVSIHADRVVLSRNGRNEVLLLRPDDPDRVLANIRLPADKEASLQLRGSKNADNILSTVDEIINLAPVRDGDVLKGYRISSGRLGDAFERAGFQADDIAIAIDGYDMTSPQQALEMLEELELLEQVSVTVERDGQLHQIQLSI